MGKNVPLDEFVEKLVVDLEGREAADEEGREAVEADDGPEADAVEYVADYLALKAQIADLEIRAAASRKLAVEALDAERSAPGKQWVFAGLGTVAVVKGRRTEKLSRTKLARAGVDPKVLDAATEVSESAPSVRISPWTDSPKDAMAAKGWQRAEE